MLKKLSALTGVISFLLFFMAGCGSNPVSLVQNGIMDDYDTTTIQKAFDASFDNPKWESFETKKGQMVVQFTGTISEDLHNTVVSKAVDLNDENSLSQFFMYYVGEPNRENETPEESAKINAILNKDGEIGAMRYYANKFIKDNIWVVGTSVEVQWLISTDGQTFELSSMGSKAWEGVEIDFILNVIYS